MQAIPMLAEIATLPDGSWEFDDYGDQDVMAEGKPPIRVHCRLTKKGTKLSFDWTKSDPQPRASWGAAAGALGAGATQPPDPLPETGRGNDPEAPQGDGAPVVKPSAGVPPSPAGHRGGQFSVTPDWEARPWRASSNLGGQFSVSPYAPAGKGARGLGPSLPLPGPEGVELALDGVEASLLPSNRGR